MVEPSILGFVEQNRYVGVLTILCLDCCPMSICVGHTFPCVARPYTLELYLIVVIEHVLRLLSTLFALKQEICLSWQPTLIHSLI